MILYLSRKKKKKKEKIRKKEGKIRGMIREDGKEAGKGRDSRNFGINEDRGSRPTETFVETIQLPAI